MDKRLKLKELKQKVSEKTKEYWRQNRRETIGMFVLIILAGILWMYILGLICDYLTK